jgi:hypothetical protein
MKYLAFIVITFFLFSCNAEDKTKQPETTVQKTETSEPSFTISDLKINNGVQVKKSKSETVLIEGKALISADRLIDFFPKKYKGIGLDEQSSGESSSGLGRFTTTTGVFEKNHLFIRVRLSDYFSSKYFPDLKYLENTPKTDGTFTFEKADLGAEIIGYVQWHKVDDYGIINLLLYDRYNLYMEINGFPELKTNYKKFIEQFDLKKLKEISSSK